MEQNKITTVMISEQQDLEAIGKEEFFYDEAKLKQFLDANADKYPRQKVSMTQIIFQFVKQLKIGADITRISMPTYILKPLSHLEVGADYSIFTVGLQKINTVKDPVHRMLLVLQWFMLRSHYIPQKGFENSKPYNPILGEFFECTIDHKALALGGNSTGTTIPSSQSHVLIEQVSHHPPISALLSYNDKHKIIFESTTRIQSTFRASGVWTYLQGYHCLTLAQLGGERYTLTYPAIAAKPGVLSSGVEYGEAVVIKCEETGLETRVEAKSNNEYAGVVKNSSTGKALLKIKGSWRDQCLYEDLVKNDGTLYELLNVDKELALEAKITKKNVKPVAKQEPYESRRVWHLVTKCVKLNQLEEAQTHKFAIEDNQRYIRRERESKHIEFTPRFFAPLVPATYSPDGVMIYKPKKLPAFIDQLPLTIRKHFLVNPSLDATSSADASMMHMTQQEFQKLSTMNEAELKATLDLE